MIYTRDLISSSSKTFNNPLVNASSKPNTIGITVIFIIHKFFSSLAISWYLPFFRFLSILIRGQLGWQSPLIVRFPFCSITKSGHLAEIKGSICILKFQRILCAYQLIVWSIFNFCPISIWSPPHPFASSLMLLQY